MKRASISLAESAVNDLEAILEWYRDQEVPEVGVRFVNGVLKRVDSLRLHPESGRVVPEFGQKFLRELVFPPFRIVYRVEPGKVKVVRVWRSERLLRLTDEDDQA